MFMTYSYNNNNNKDIFCCRNLWGFSSSSSSLNYDDCVSSRLSAGGMVVRFQGSLSPGRKKEKKKSAPPPPGYSINRLRCDSRNDDQTLSQSTLKKSFDTLLSSG